MAGTKELPKTTGRSLRELSARTTLNQVRSEGHPYVDLREDGNAFIFFCTICLAPCYNDNTLYDHLGGKLHSRRYAAVKVTLLGPNPFPFSDGALFFHGLPEQDKLLPTVSTKPNQPQHRLLSIGFKNSDIGKISNSVNEGSEVLEGQEPVNKSNSLECVVRDCVNETSDSNDYLVIPDVVCNDQLSDLKVKFIGFGEIAARICEKDNNRSIRTIWCAWLGEGQSGHGSNVPDNDFAIINFSYNYTLGRAGITEESHARLTSGAYLGNVNKKKRKSLSDPEDVSKSLRKTRVSGERDCIGEQSQNAKVKLSRTARQALRKQQQIVSNCMCDICQQKILPGKDVSTLLNMKTMRLACSSRNRNGAFHVFHTSCLIHWILLCEYEVWMNQFGSRKMILGSQGVTSGSQGDGRAKVELSIVPKTPLSSVFCTECQGRGVNVEENLENPSVFLSEMFKFKIKLLDGHKEWMFKGPEVLNNCSTGLRFSNQFNEAVQGNVTPLKMMYFFRADL